MQLKVSFEGAFEKAIQKRINAWTKADAIGSKLTVPPEHGWWYWQEFGTAGQGNKGGASYQIPGPDHPEPFKILVIDGEFRRGPVRHFGIRARRPIRDIMPQLVQMAKKSLRASFAEGSLDRPAVMKRSIRNILKETKKEIVKSFAERVPGSRAINPEFPKQSGKLLGKTAAQVLNRVMKVEDLE